MQTTPSVPKPQLPPVAPALAGADAGAPVTLASLDGMSMSALLSLRGEISKQMTSSMNRRADLAHDLRRTNSLAQDGVIAHINQLDGRILQLESDLNVVGRKISEQSRTSQSAPPPFGRGSNPFGISSDDMIPIVIVFTIFVLSPIAISISRFLWKRGNRPAAPVARRDSDLRMERVEQAVDAIAVEIERISEGQRFVTQLLSKPAPSALGLGQPVAEPIRIASREEVNAKSF
ncbi:MAG: hypothetical protein ABJB66_11580 [Gemmatimonadaceae bacterium]